MPDLAKMHSQDQMLEASPDLWAFNWIAKTVDVIFDETSVRVGAVLRFTFFPKSFAAVEIKKFI